jgi:hypothetical protein
LLTTDGKCTKRIRQLAGVKLILGLQQIISMLKNLPRRSAAVNIHSENGLDKLNMINNLWQRRKLTLSPIAIFM